MESDSHPIQWIPTLSVGVAEIDAQHRALVDHFNAILADVDAGRLDVLGGRLAALGHKTATHFQFEESCFDRLDEASRKAHGAEHRRLLEEFGNLVADWESERLTTRELVHFIARWLMRHIAAVDIPTFRSLIAAATS